MTNALAPVVRGQVIHQTGKGLNDKDPDPVHNVKIELYADGFFGDKKVGSTRTDKFGHFEFDVSSLADNNDLVLKIVDRPWHLRNRWFPSFQQKTIRKIELPNTNTGETKDLGKIPIDFWEYQDGTFGRLRMPKNKDDRPQESSKGYTIARLRAGFDEILARKLIVPIIKKSASLEQIQKLFGDNLTLRQEEKAPGSTRTGEWLATRVLNGFNPADLRKGSKDGEYLIEYVWDKYTIDNVHELPNARLKMETVDGRLIATEVSLQHRHSDPDREVLPPVGKGSVLGDWKTYRQGDPKFTDALKEFRTAYFVAGETDMHLGIGHLNVEQYAVAAFRNLHDTVLEKLLFPFLREVVLINHEGNGLIFGESGVIPQASALTPASVEERLKDTLGSCDWKGYKPRAPIGDDHQFAHVANTYWDLVGEFVDEFFEKNDAEIRSSWHSVQKFSKDLTRHAVPFQGRLGAEHSEWADNNEIANPELPRVTYDGAVRALSSITTSDTANEQDMQNLKKCSQYAIFMGSFWHSWCNDHQKEDGGEVAYASFGPQNSTQQEKGREKELEDAAYQLFIVNVLVESKYGLLLKNHNNDVPKELREKVLKAAEVFRRHHYDPWALRSMINI